MNTYKWLLKREFWEHKGGFFWAPAIASAIYLFFSVIGSFVVHAGLQHTQHNGHDVNMGTLAAQVSDPAHASDLANALQAIFQIVSAPPLIVAVFVVFFYCLGCLFDERKDRSLLFWKSLPVSDGQTVASKVISAMLVAPLIAVTIAVATGLLFFMLTSAFVVAHGASAMPLWNIGSIAAGIANMVLSIPMWALWALPTVGWLMLCSSFASRVPFLWAVLSPVLLGAIVAIVNVMPWFGLTNEWYWANIPGRLLGGLVPGIELLYRHANVSVNGPQDLARVLSLGNSYAGMANPQLWIGALVGAAMILGALRIRKYRAED